MTRDLSYDDECDDGTGSAIGDSNVLRMLKVWRYDPGIHWLDEFCFGQQHNRSIECLMLRFDVSPLPSERDRVFQIIAPFFERNRKLRCIDIESY